MERAFVLAAAASIDSAIALAWSWIGLLYRLAGCQDWPSVRSGLVARLQGWCCCVYRLGVDDAVMNTLGLKSLGLAVLGFTMLGSTGL